MYQETYYVHAQVPTVFVKFPNWNPVAVMGNGHCTKVNSTFQIPKYYRQKLLFNNVNPCKTEKSK